MQVNISLNNRILIILAIIILLAVGGYLFWRHPKPQQDGATLSSVLSSEQQAFGMRLLSESEDSNNYVRSEMKICLDNGGRNNCYKEVGKLLFDQMGYQKVLDSFQANEAYPEIFSRCHEVTHYLGRSAYLETKSIPALYNQDRSVCHGGFYHGVIEGYFAEKNLLVLGEPSAELASNIKSVCGNSNDYSVPRFYSECVHGIGHAMMYITDAELPESLKFCDALSTRSDQQTCYGGALMENSSSSTNFDHPSKYLSATDQNYPCTILAEQYLQQCYEYQSSYFAELAKWDWQKVVTMCGQVPAAYQQGCFHIVGTNQVGFTQDQATWIKDCNYISTKDYRASCYAGIISSLGGRYVGEGSHMIAFCGLVDIAMQEPCFRALGNVVSTWSQDGSKRGEVCAKLEKDKAKTWCKQG